MTEAKVSSEDIVKSFRELAKQMRRSYVLSWKLCTHPDAKPEQILEVLAKARENITVMKGAKKQLLTLLEKRDRTWLYGIVAQTEISLGE